MSKLLSDISKANAQARSAASGGSSAMREIWTGAMREIGAALVQLTEQAVESVVELGKAGVEYNAQMEQYTASFKTMLGGSKEAADGMIESLREFAADTPLVMSDLAKGAQTLLGFGESADTVIDTLKMMGDVSLGDSQRMQSLTLAFAQTSATGKLMGQDLLQMVNAGFNPLKIIAEETGISIGDLKSIMSDGSLKNVSEETGAIFDALRQKMEAGDALTEWETLTLSIFENLEISADVVRTSFESATSEGGLFFGAMDEQAQTLNGRLSTLEDNFAEFSGRLAQNLTPAVGEAVTMLSSMIEEGGILEDSLTDLFDSVAGIATDALPGFVDIVSRLLPPLGQLAADLLPPIASLIGQLTPLLASAAADIFPYIVESVDALLPLAEVLIGDVLPPFLDVVTALLPHLVQIAQALLPPMVELFSALVPILQMVANAVGPMADEFLWAFEPLEGIMDIIRELLPLLEILTEILLVVLGAAIKELGAVFRQHFADVIENCKNMLSGWIDFLAGTFTGDWERAWNGVKRIFSSVWDAIRNAAEAVLNTIIGLINSLIDGINTVLGLFSDFEIDTIDFVDFDGDNSGGSAPGGSTVGASLSSGTAAQRYAVGEDFIMSDWTPAFLDRGERVLTADENARYTRLGGIRQIEHMLSAGIAPAPAAAPLQASFTLTGDVQMDGFKVGTVVLRNLDDAASFTLKG